MKIEYNTFYIKKRNGKKRKIEQPLEPGMQYLKDLLEEFYGIEELKPSYFSHAFMKGRNICTMADQHFGNKYLLRIDIKDFFTSITLRKFEDKVTGNPELIEKIKPCFRGEGPFAYLPQGAPTSPFLANSYMKSFDWKCAWYCQNFGVTYSRYADDMYISSKTIDSKFWSCQVFISQLLKSYNLVENKDKRRLSHPGKRMNVTGVIINEKFQVDRKTRRKIRAILHNAKDGKLTNEQKGLINFKNMVDNNDKKPLTNIQICTNILVANKV